MSASTLPAMPTRLPKPSIIEAAGNKPNRDGGAAATVRGFWMPAVMLALATASAMAEPKLEPKLEPPPPPRVREIAHRLFEEAATAMAAGTLDVAIARYHELDRLAPHPNIAFNLALAYERRGELVDAIKHYDKYLAVETGDTKVARHIAGLRATPGQVALEARTKFAPTAGGGAGAGAGFAASVPRLGPP